MKNFSKSDYLKFEYDKINNLFLSGKFDIVIEKSKKLIKKILHKYLFIIF